MNRIKSSLAGPILMIAAVAGMLLIGCGRSSDAQAIVAEGALPDRLTRYMDHLAANEFAGAVLVAQNGEVVFKEGYGQADVEAGTPNTAQTVFDSGSLSKQFTAAAIMLLVERGQLMLDEPLSTYLDNVPADKAEITLHQLLIHGSGLPSYVYAGDFVETGRAEALRLAFAAELEHPPGERYLYSDTGYGVLAAVVEEVAGVPFTTFMQTEIFGPAGMDSTGFYNDPKWGSVTVANGYNGDRDFGSAGERPGPYWGLLGFGGVLTTVEDLFKWSMVLREGTLLSEQSISLIFTPHLREFARGSSFYGYGWVVEDLGERGTVIWHDGATDSQNSIMLMYGDANQTTVIVLSNRIDGGWFRETFYGTDTGFALGRAVATEAFTDFPSFAR